MGGVAGEGVAGEGVAGEGVDVLNGVVQRATASPCCGAVLDGLS